MSDMTPESIFQLASGFMAAKHLFVANEIGLFEKLAPGPATLDTLAELTGIARPRVRILADALVTLGLIERHDNQYQNGPVAAAFLGAPAPGRTSKFAGGRDGSVMMRRAQPGGSLRRPETETKAEPMQEEDETCRSMRTQPSSQRPGTLHR